MGDMLCNLLSEAFEIALIDVFIARMYAVQSMPRRNLYLYAVARFLY